MSSFDEQKPLKPLTNDDMVCKTCRYKDSNPKRALSCEIYSKKPLQVLKGGVCERYGPER